MLCHFNASFVHPKKLLAFVFVFDICTEAPHFFFIARTIEAPVLRASLSPRFGQTCAPSNFEAPPATGTNFTRRPRVHRNTGFDAHLSSSDTFSFVRPQVIFFRSIFRAVIFVFHSQHCFVSIDSCAIDLFAVAI